MAIATLQQRNQTSENHENKRTCHNKRVNVRLSDFVFAVGIGVLFVFQFFKSVTTLSYYSANSNDEIKFNKTHARPQTDEKSVRDENSIDVNHDWFVDRDHWTSNPITDACTYVENVCHSTQEWFYDPKPDSYQPNLTLNVHSSASSGYPSILSIQKEAPSSQSNCQYSPILNHMSLFSFSNHMLGEFYIRSFMGAWDIYKAIDSPLFHVQTQIYLHLQDSMKGILESHNLFLDLLTKNSVLSFFRLLDNTHCQCVKRLFFCGYDAEENSKTKHIVIRPSGHVGIIDHQSHEDPYNSTISQDEDKAILRRAILETFIEKNPTLQTKIQDYRQNILNHNVGNNINTSEWKIVGLAQRSSRRKWKNLFELKKKCNSRYQKFKIVCVEVNIETQPLSNSIMHLVAHASLDALIGIHGAQLTEAILMPSGSLVLEFLPWIHPDIEYGKWTSWANRPTPLGLIFSNTDLNHIGYPLVRNSSIDECNDEMDIAEEIGCFRRPENQWDNRDFQVSPEILYSILNKFVVTNIFSCSDYISQAGDDYVLYNVNCIPGRKMDMEVKHFYREKSWAKAKQHAGITEAYLRKALAYLYEKATETDTT